ncbi:polysaccharide pyruvyl transferase family protein [Metabacillus litoralis]|uniref:polysaccharide pyruvyl transferase family protein n=1 Tax=Metabacillus litoralis TaxID=152268 RepID=UPI001CFF468A|nr:polysaccharide pyruvyl transferase family protein [Metabacillus litoralis]
MKTIMIYAYTNYNLGDDLFIQILCKKYPKIKFVLYTPDKKYKHIFKNINNLKCLSYDLLSIRMINFIARKLFKINDFHQTSLKNSCDGAVHIGGSLFMQQKDWENYFEKYTKSKNIKNKPFFLLGANFGPFNEQEYYERHKKTFKEYTDICFRDSYSYNLFKELPNVRMADDIIFQLKRQKILQEENHIVVSVIKPSFRKNLFEYDDVYFNKIKEISVYFIEQGFNVTYISFCENEGDKEAINNIVDLMPRIYKDKIKKHFYSTNIEETLDLIASSKFVVATRFHSMILGWLYKKPVFPIVYSEKMTNVIDDVGFKGLYTKLNNISNINPVDVYGCINTNAIDVSKQVKNAEKQFEKLDEYLLK